MFPEGEGLRRAGIPAGRYAGILAACRLEGGVAAGWKPALRKLPHSGHSIWKPPPLQVA